MLVLGTRWSRWAALLAVLMLAVVAAGCGGGDGYGEEGAAPEGGKAAATTVEEPSEPVTVTFASWVGQDMKPLAKQFQKEHPNITIKFQNVPAEQISQKLTAQIAGGNPPDAAFVDASTTSAFASRNALVNLDPYVAGSEVVDPDDYVEAFKISAVYEDSLYGLPFDGESTGLFYRTDLFREAGIAGPPKTWEEFEQAARKLTKPERKQYGYILFAPESAYYFYPWLWQAGGEVLSEDNEQVLFDSEEAKRAADFYVGLTKYAPKDFLNSNSWDGRIAFAQGKVAMYMAGAWFAGTLTEEFPKIKGKWAAAPLPEGEAGCATTIAGDNLVLFEGGENHDAAWLWIEFLSRPENMARWTFGSPGSTLLPPRKSLLESPQLTEKKPILKGFAEAMECGVTNTIANPKWPRIEEALNEQLGNAMYGKIEPAAALEAAAEAGEEILAE